MIVPSIRNVTFIGSFLLWLIAGCTGRPSRIKPPVIDPDKAGQMAIAQYDADADGALSAEELDQCPGIKRATAIYDPNSDQSVSAGEIAERIRTWQDSKVGIMSMACTVRLDGLPLEGATVQFIPERYLSEAVKPASGTTDMSGRATISVTDADLSEDQKGLVGVHIGVYKVQVTHPERSIPSKYNTDTNLGQEVAQDNPDMINMSVVFDL